LTNGSGKMRDSSGYAIEPGLALSSLGMRIGKLNLTERSRWVIVVQVSTAR